MKKHELTFVVCRVLSIYILVRAYVLLQSVIPMFLESGKFPYYYTVISSVWFISMLAAGCLMWKYSGWLAKKMLNGVGAGNDNAVVGLSADDLLEVGIIIIGVWITALSIPKCVNALLGVFSFRENLVSNNISCFVELIIGSFMMFGSKMVKGFIKTIRNAGR